jgi:hypothetical protein
MNKIRERFQQLCIADYMPDYLIIYRHVLYCILATHDKYVNKENS